MFTSGSTFNFEAAVPSPRMTRARRASMNFDVVALKPNKRMSLAPGLKKVEELASGRGRRKSMAPNASSAKEVKDPSIKAKATTKRRSLAVPVKKDLATPKRRSKKAPVVVEETEQESPEFIFDPRPSRTITPAKTLKAAPSPVKKVQESTSKAVKASKFYSSSPGLGLKKGSQLQVTGSPKKTPVQASPTKKFSKNSSRILTEEDIEARLMAEFDSPPAEARIQPKTFETDIPTEKVKPRRREVMIKSPVVKAAKKEKKIKNPNQVATCHSDQEHLCSPNLTCRFTCHQLHLVGDQEGGGEIVSLQDQGRSKCHLQSAGGGAYQQGQSEMCRANSCFKEPRKKGKDKEEL